MNTVENRHFGQHYTHMGIADCAARVCTATGVLTLKVTIKAPLAAAASMSPDET